MDFTHSKTPRELLLLMSELHNAVLSLMLSCLHKDCRLFAVVDSVVNEYFMEFYDTLSIKSEALYKIVMDFFKDQILDIKNLRGQCYDGANNVSGRISGWQTRI